MLRQPSAIVAVSLWPVAWPA